MIEKEILSLTKELILGGAQEFSSFFTGVATVCFQNAVPNELETIFRRGQEWEAGLELILALARQPGSSEADADEFLHLTQQLAVSSAFGAVEANFGECMEVLHHAGENSIEKPDIMMLIRFQTTDQLSQFVRCPPIAAVLEGDKRAPLKTLWTVSLRISPSEYSSSSSQQAS